MLFIQLFSCVAQEGVPCFAGVEAERRVPIRRNFSRPFLPSELRGRNELRLCETRNSLARVPGATEPPWRIPPRYPFCFRRMVCLSSRDVPSTLKVIFRRPENVKPSAVSKRSLGAGGCGVSKFPSYPTVPPLSFPPSFPPCVIPAYEPGLSDEKRSPIFFSPNPWVQLIASSNFEGDPRVSGYSFWILKPLIDRRDLDCLSRNEFVFFFQKGDIHMFFRSFTKIY